jgi:hypothetical protein
LARLGDSLLLPDFGIEALLGLIMEVETALRVDGSRTADRGNQ